ncbi:MAG: DMT family transporter [Candidatus Binatia bacterium]
MNPSPPAPVSSYLLLFLPPFFWSTNFIVGKALVGSVPPWTLNTGRFTVAALILIPLFLYRREWRAIPKDAITILVLMSVTGVFAFNSLLYTGLHYTTAINATLVNATTPVTTACLAWLFIAEKMTWRRLLGILLSLTGIGWIVSHGSLETLTHLRFNPGDIIVFFATTLWGFYSVMAKRMMQQISPFALTAITTGIGVLFLLPAALLELSWSPADLSRQEVLLGFLYLGIFPSFVAFLIWNRSILIFGPGRATLVYNSMPLFAVILSVAFLSETLMAYQVIGGVIIIAGVIIGTMEPAQPDKPMTPYTEIAHR